MGKGAGKAGEGKLPRGSRKIPKYEKDGHFSLLAKIRSGQIEEQKKEEEQELSAFERLAQQPPPQIDEKRIEHLSKAAMPGGVEIGKPRAPIRDFLSGSPDYSIHQLPTSELPRDAKRTVTLKEIQSPAPSLPSTHMVQPQAEKKKLQLVEVTPPKPQTKSHGGFFLGLFGKGDPSGKNQEHPPQGKGQAPQPHATSPQSFYSPPTSQPASGHLSLCPSCGAAIPPNMPACQICGRQISGLLPKASGAEKQPSLPFFAPRPKATGEMPAQQGKPGAEKTDSLPFFPKARQGAEPSSPLSIIFGSAKSAAQQKAAQAKPDENALREEEKKVKAIFYEAREEKRRQDALAAKLEGDLKAKLAMQEKLMMSEQRKTQEEMEAARRAKIHEGESERLKQERLGIRLGAARFKQEGKLRDKAASEERKLALAARRKEMQERKGAAAGAKARAREEALNAAKAKADQERKMKEDARQDERRQREERANAAKEAAAAAALKEELARKALEEAEQKAYGVSPLEALMGISAEQKKRMMEEKDRQAALKAEEELSAAKVRIREQERQANALKAEAARLEKEAAELAKKEEGLLEDGFEVKLPPIPTDASAKRIEREFEKQESEVQRQSSRRARAVQEEFEKRRDAEEGNFEQEARLLRKEWSAKAEQFNSQGAALEAEAQQEQKEIRKAARESEASVAYALSSGRKTLSDAISKAEEASRIRAEKEKRMQALFAQKGSLAKAASEIAKAISSLEAKEDSSSASVESIAKDKEGLRAKIAELSLLALDNKANAKQASLELEALLEAKTASQRGARSATLELENAARSRKAAENNLKITEDALKKAQSSFASLSQRAEKFEEERKAALEEEGTLGEQGAKEQSRLQGVRKKAKEAAEASMSASAKLEEISRYHAKVEAAEGAALAVLRDAQSRHSAAEKELRALEEEKEQLDSKVMQTAASVGARPDIGDGKKEAPPEEQLLRLLVAQKRVASNLQRAKKASEQLSSVLAASRADEEKARSQLENANERLEHAKIIAKEHIEHEKALSSEAESIEGEIQGLASKRKGAQSRISTLAVDSLLAEKINAAQAKLSDAEARHEAAVQAGKEAKSREDIASEALKAAMSRLEDASGKLAGIENSRKEALKMALSSSKEKQALSSRLSQINSSIASLNSSSSSMSAKKSSLQQKQEAMLSQISSLSSRVEAASIEFAKATEAHCLAQSRKEEAALSLAKSEAVLGEAKENARASLQKAKEGALRGRSSLEEEFAHAKEAFEGGLESLKLALNAGFDVQKKECDEELARISEEAARRVLVLRQQKDLLVESSLKDAQERRQGLIREKEEEHLQKENAAKLAAKKRHEIEETAKEAKQQAFAKEEELGKSRAELARRQSEEELRRQMDEGQRKAALQKAQEEARKRQLGMTIIDDLLGIKPAWKEQMAAEAQKRRQIEAARKIADGEFRRKQAELKLREDEEKLKREALGRRQEEERKKKEEEMRIKEAEEKRKQQEIGKKREEERKKKEEEMRIKEAEEKRKQQEIGKKREEERKKKEEEMRIKEAEEKRKREEIEKRQEAQRKKREEELRLKEQAEKLKAQEARREAEEAMRRKLEQSQAILAQRRRLKEDGEKRRIEEQKKTAQEEQKKAEEEKQRKEQEEKLRLKQEEEQRKKHDLQLKRKYGIGPIDELLGISIEMRKKELVLRRKKREEGARKYAEYSRKQQEQQNLLLEREHRMLIEQERKNAEIARLKLEMQENAALQERLVREEEKRRRMEQERQKARLEEARKLEDGQRRKEKEEAEKLESQTRKAEEEKTQLGRKQAGQGKTPTNEGAPQYRDAKAARGESGVTIFDELLGVTPEQKKKTAERELARKEEGRKRNEGMAKIGEAGREEALHQAQMQKELVRQQRLEQEQSRKAEAERKKKEQEQQKTAENKKREEEQQRLALERQKTAENKKREEEQQRLALERQKTAENKKREEEQQRLAQELQKTAENKKREEEQQRLALERQKQRMEEERRIDQTQKMLELERQKSALERSIQLKTKPQSAGLFGGLFNFGAKETAVPKYAAPARTAAKMPPADVPTSPMKEEGRSVPKKMAAEAKKALPKISAKELANQKKLEKKAQVAVEKLKKDQEKRIKIEEKEQLLAQKKQKKQEEAGRKAEEKAALQRAKQEEAGRKAEEKAALQRAKDEEARQKQGEKAALQMAKDGEARQKQEEKATVQLATQEEADRKAKMQKSESRLMPSDLTLREGAGLESQLGEIRTEDPLLRKNFLAEKLFPTKEVPPVLPEPPHIIVKDEGYEQKTGKGGAALAKKKSTLGDLFSSMLSLPDEAKAEAKPVQPEGGKEPQFEKGKSLPLQKGVSTMSEKEKKQLGMLMPSKFDLSELESMTRPENTEPVSLPEWNSFVMAELAMPRKVMPLASFFESASFEQKKFIQALRTEALYWKFKDDSLQPEQRRKAEARFLSILENASIEQRATIELCINLKKALKSVEIATSNSSSKAMVGEALAVYGLIMSEHPEIKQPLCYLIARKAMQISFVKDRLEPSGSYLFFLSRLDDEQRDWAFAMRASFFDSIMSDETASRGVRQFAATAYSRLLMSRPNIAGPLEHISLIRNGLKLAEGTASMNIEQAKAAREQWLKIIRDFGQARQILFYLQAMAFTSELESDDSPDEGGRKKGKG